mmetsp:Transcript_63440/g.95778  ORF Transcript_63440/g.95778 Transcript_63440/m.95778 type:complete len:106 (-) Transcript_63440:85-402(-)
MMCTPTSARTMRSGTGVTRGAAKLAPLGTAWIAMVLREGAQERNRCLGIPHNRRTTEAEKQKKFDGGCEKVEGGRDETGMDCLQPPSRSYQVCRAARGMTCRRGA